MEKSIRIGTILDTLSRDVLSHWPIKNIADSTFYNRRRDNDESASALKEKMYCVVKMFAKSVKCWRGHVSIDFSLTGTVPVESTCLY